MPLVEDGVTGYLTARNYSAFCGVDAEIRFPALTMKSDQGSKI
jgi:hypothetical protein